MSDTRRECVKCEYVCDPSKHPLVRGAAFKVEYIHPKMIALGVFTDGNQLRITCPVCGHWVDEPCKDAEKEDLPKGILQHRADRVPLLVANIEELEAAIEDLEEMNRGLRKCSVKIAQRSLDKPIVLESYNDGWNTAINAAGNLFPEGERINWIDKGGRTVRRPIRDCIRELKR